MNWRAWISCRSLPEIIVIMEIVCHSPNETESVLQALKIVGKIDSRSWSWGWVQTFQVEDFLVDINFCLRIGSRIR